MKKALFVSLVAVGISLLSDFLFCSMHGVKGCMAYHYFYGYAWLVILALGEAFFCVKACWPDVM